MITRNNFPRLCIVSSYEFTDTNATKARLGAYIEILSSRFDITLMSPDGSDPPIKSSAKLVSLGGAPARGGFVSRAIREFSYSVKAWKNLRQLRPDVVMVSSPSMFLLILPNLKIGPTILDIRDLTWEYLPDSSFTYRFVKFGFRILARSAIRDADIVLVTNDREYHYVDSVLKSKLINIPVRIVRNGISLIRFEAISKLPDNRDLESPVLLYVGNVGIAQNLTTIIDVANQFPSIRVLIIGEGRDLDRVKQHSKKCLASNITFVGGVPWEALKEYYSQASMLYAQITSSYDSAIPSKLYEYLSVGVPIIYAGNGVAVDFLSEFDDVKIVEPENPEALSDAIKIFLERIRLPRNYGNSHIIQEKYQRERQVRNISDLVFDLLK